MKDQGKHSPGDIGPLSNIYDHRNQNNPVIANSVAFKLLYKYTELRMLR